MASKKDFSMDALEAFEIERPKKAPLPKEPSNEADETMREPIVQVQKREKAKKPDAPLTKGVSEKKPNRESDELMRRTFYIKRSQYKAIKMRAIESERPEDKDTSAIIRADVDMYLAKK